MVARPKQKDRPDLWEIYCISDGQQHRSLILLNMHRAGARHSPPMIDAQTPLSRLPTETVQTGTVLLQRSVANNSVIFVDKGRVALGVVGTGADHATVEHQLGVVDGPCWLEATAAVLNVPSAVDAVAQTEVQLRRMPLDEFRACLTTCAAGVQSMMLDIARAHRQQTDLTVSRLAKDAESRCAEWLLSHAEASDTGGCAVHLQQRKRAIAAQLGIAPETLSRVLRHLRELRLISGSGRVVDLVDLAGLRSLAGSSSPCECGLV
jgi:CRP-like cAMP-binding protein